MRYFNKTDKTEAIDGVHDISQDFIVELPEDNVFFSSLPEGKEITYDVDGLPTGLQDVQVTLTEADYTVRVQELLDTEAQSLGYDNIHTAATYADEELIAKFQQEGSALRAWRSSVWSACYAILADVTEGNRSQPTVEQLISELPTFSLPE